MVRLRSHIIPFFFFVEKPDLKVKDTLYFKDSVNGGGKILDLRGQIKR